MIEIKVKGDWGKIAERLDEIQKRQLPFATAQALTLTAKAAAAVVTQSLPAIFNKGGPPTRFTQNAVGIKPATKAGLVALVFIKDAQAQYLLLEETGGVRDATSLVVPGKNLRLNASGNIPRGTIKRLIAQMQQGGGSAPAKRGAAKAATFFYMKGKGPAGGPGGIFKRLPGGHLQRVVSFVGQEHFQPRFQYRRHVAIAAHKAFRPLMEKCLAEALRTAR